MGLSFWNAFIIHREVSLILISFFHKTLYGIQLLFLFCWSFSSEMSEPGFLLVSWLPGSPSGVFTKWYKYSQIFWDLPTLYPFPSSSSFSFWPLSFSPFFFPNSAWTVLREFFFFFFPEQDFVLEGNFSFWLPRVHRAQNISMLSPLTLTGKLESTRSAPSHPSLTCCPETAHFTFQWVLWTTL